MHEVLLNKGFANLPVWITETGKEANASNATELEAQRKYVERVMAAQNTRSWWQRTFIYELTEEHPNGMWPDIHWGLALRVADPDATYTDNFQRKPAFDDLAGCIAKGTAGSGGVGGSAGASAGGSAGSAGSSGAGGTAGSVAGGGTTASGGAGASGGTFASGGASSGGSGAKAGVGGSGSGAKTTDYGGGCGCRLRERGSSAGIWLLGALVVLRLRRRI